MAYLAAAVTLTTLLSAGNAVLLLAVIRRLARGGTGAALPPGVARVENLLPEPGTVVADFAASAVDGEPVSRDLLAGTTLVGFISPKCPPCVEELPRFVASANGVPGGRDQVLAVVPGTPAEVADTVRALRDVARVVVEDHGGPLAAAFGTRAFPSFCLLDGDGRVRASANRCADLAADLSHDLGELPAPARRG
jgi:hypothetical protein